MTRLVLIATLAGFGCAQPARPAPSEKRDEKRDEKAATPAPKEAANKADGGDHKDEAEHEGLPSRVQLSADVINSAGIKTAAVEMSALPQTVALTGEVIADPDRAAKITTRVAGRIVEVFVKEGDRVKSGALIAIVESPELAKARAAFTAANARYRSAQRNAERLANVAAKGLASGQEVQAAQAEASALEAEARAARQTLDAFGPSATEDGGSAARLQLRSPIAGGVLSRDAVRGQTVNADHVVATIADLSKAYFTARLFEKDLARIRPGAAGEVRLNAYPNEVFEGAVDSVGKQLDPTARTVLARIAVKDHGGLLKVGLFGTALIVVPDRAPRTPRVVVPLSAVTKIADREVVFVREPDQDFEVHPVTLGRSAAGRVEILSGLRAGEHVVVEGVFTLKSAVLKSTFGEEE